VFTLDSGKMEVIWSECVAGEGDSGVFLLRFFFADCEESIEGWK
jgi:hypothetical protein